MAELVIGGALLAVLEHLVGLVEFLEPVLRINVPRIAIRVQFHGELAECRLEIGIRSTAFDAENFVIIPFGHATLFLRSAKHPSRKPERV